MKAFSCSTIALLAATFALAAEPHVAAPWVPDQGDGTYRNPVLYADYSDPDAIRVGDDFWMTSSSFHHVPGLPILHSRDLVNWQLVNHALPVLVPADHFASVRPGEGVWAPSIRFHDHQYWIYYPDPDFGLYLVTASDPRERWSTPVLVKAGKGMIDPCPFWDDDGQLYLVHGWARSRGPVANRLTLLKLSADGTRPVDAGTDIIDANKLEGWRTLEGPKMYKRMGYYYVFAPAGGVKEGYQAVFRSRKIGGPYESRIVLDQGRTPVNGPHQGAWVDTPSGENWFLHFQDRGPYGRIVHLQPMAWRDDGWPAVGTAVQTGAEKGEPVAAHRKPAVPPQPIAAPPTTDEFETATLGLQWQWQANPDARWHSLRAQPGSLQLAAVPHPAAESLWTAPNLLLQKFPASAFTVTTKLSFHPAAEGDRAGLVVFGYDYAWLGLRRAATGVQLVLVECRNANAAGREKIVATGTAGDGPMWLRVTVTGEASCRFSYSPDGRDFTPIGDPFAASPSRWVGAKVGLFACGSAAGADRERPPARANIDWFRVEPGNSVP